MRIFVDEDTGSSIAKALNAVGIPTEYPSASKHSPVKTGDDDCKWLPFAGDKGMLVLSRNIAILQVEAERDLILAHKVGIVFLPAYLTRIDLLRLVMKKWDWLLEIDASDDRPFAYYVTPTGRTVRLPLTSEVVRRLRRLAKRPTTPARLPATYLAEESSLTPG